MQICNSCHGGCCRKHNIDVTGFDILKIADALNLEISFFTEALPHDENYARTMGNKIALFKFSDGDKKAHYRMSLKMRESLLFPDTFKCMFLQEWKGEDQDSPNFDKVISRCGIYSIRPHICSVYPSKLNEDGLSAYYVDPFSEKADNIAYKTCPRPVIQEDFDTNSVETIHNLVMYKFEQEFFRKIATKWNKNPKASNELEKFLREEYNNRSMVKPRIFKNEFG